MKLTPASINSALEPLGRHRFDVVGMAVERIKARQYPRGSLGFAAYADVAQGHIAHLCRWDVKLTLAQLRAAYALARAILSR